MPSPVVPAGDSDATLSLYVSDQYVVRRQVLKLFGAAFHVYDATGRLVFYSKQKAFKLKEDIRLYTDEQMHGELLYIQARQVIDFAASYDVYDQTSGQKVGALRRRGFKSVFRDEWTILDPRDGELGRVVEDSAVMALIRRFVPYANFLFPQKYHVEVGGQRVCMVRQHFAVFALKYTLDFAPDRQHQLDRRLGIAAAVLLAAIEGFQE